ncbi:response regulator transcription factor [Pseudoxanthomonas indica]|uniref:Two component transcriptional regulator, LuxR family n=1 Tax=Pseudoxanthomonas indica TaxID=428993 RepID=A0A1T5M1H1_9GAMM|nr:response regulator [Pseudoxanthomonas indica]GGD60417.1 DNA-binding response regulator [Pseudoxanthomonas indica]SKC82102.1 two component transcriptional regulator, LuxR family [Pseudoxanthomonas indica]
MTAVVHIVDDDPGVLTAMARCLKADGLNVSMSQSTREFLDRYDPGAGGCVVLDLQMPGMDGLQLQRLLQDLEQRPPLIFVSGQADVASCAHAMRAGALDFLTKPVESDVLIAAVLHGLQTDAEQRARRDVERNAEQRWSSLTPREKQVLPHILAGRLNKQIAVELGVALKTIKVHRARIMQKLGVRSVAELVRVSESAHVQVAGSRC